MNGYRLRGLLELRCRTADEALGSLGRATLAASAEAEAYRRLLAELEHVRLEASAATREEGNEALQIGARHRERRRAQVRRLLKLSEFQRERLARAEGEVERTRRSFVRARADREALELHRLRWHEERRALRLAAQERELEDWQSARQLVIAERYGSRT